MDEKIINLWRGKERSIYIYIEPYHDTLLCTTYIHIHTHVSFTIYGGERKEVYTYISNSNHTMTRYYVLHIYIHTHTYLLQFVEGKGKEYIHIYIYIYILNNIYHDMLLCTTYIHTHTRIFYNSTHIEIVHRWTRK